LLLGAIGYGIMVGASIAYNKMTGKTVGGA
jgi:hypothetical protein